jgi:uncharacterized spore protein YtfJ
VKRADEQTPQAQQQSVGGGPGGGGGSNGRPIAVIVIGPDGVTVKPMVDATRVALASITALGAMLMMLGKMMRAGRRT